MQSDDVGLREQLVEARADARSSFRRTARVRQRTEARQQLRDAGADAAEAHDPDRAVGELAAEQLLRIPAGPFARAEGSAPPAEAAARRQASARPSARRSRS